MALGRTFIYSFAAGSSAVLLMAATTRWPQDPDASATAVRQPAPPAKPAAAAQSRPLLEGVAVREQISLADVARIGAEGYRTLIDLRPDGEAPDQPRAAEIESAARQAGLQFAYIPTAHGDIPDATPEALARALLSAERPVLLYCRSGSRAARVWALAEAARIDGPDAAAIAKAVRGAGQKVDDILPRIEQRIAQRPH